jgi:hypothetical protein
MSTVTLVESAKLSQDLLIQGIIESIVVVDSFYSILPFSEIDGNALAYNRENAMGDVQFADVGDTITAKAPATFTQVTSSLTTLIGDAEVNGLIQATRSNINDQKAVQISSKAKNIGLTFRDRLISGTGSNAEFEGLLSLVAASQTINAGDNGAALSFEILDELMDQVKDKNGIVDYMMMPSRTLRSYFTLLRTLGGAGIGEVVTLPSGIQVPGYRGTPIFRNDNIPTDQVQGTETASTSIIAGSLDDGSMSYGISGLTARGEAGIRVTNIGESETKDESITRIKFYNGLANYNELGLAVTVGINN